MGEGLTDEQAMELLTLLHRYIKEYAPDIPQTIKQLALDLAETMGPTFFDDAMKMALDIQNMEGVT